MSSKTELTAEMKKELQDMLAELDEKIKKKENTVQNILLRRIFEKIVTDDYMPWERTFSGSSVSFTTCKPYQGINRFLLDDGEYITFKALNEFNADIANYNKKHGTNYVAPFRMLAPEENDTALIKRMKKPYQIVVFKWCKKPLTKAEEEAYHRGELQGITVEWDEKKKKYVSFYSILRYFTVLNTTYLRDVNGNPFPHKLNVEYKEENADAEQVLQNYFKSTGVKFNPHGKACYYTEATDTVTICPLENTSTVEDYYINGFHESVHSTGIKSRLNRACFKDYHTHESERGQEELVAMMGACLLGSACGILSTDAISRGKVVENVQNYMFGWVRWMYQNPKQLLLAMTMANNACNYILKATYPDVDEDATDNAENNEG